VKRQLTENSLMPAEWGGDTEFVEVSAKKKQGIEKLLETICWSLIYGNSRPIPTRRDGHGARSRVDKDAARWLQY